MGGWEGLKCCCCELADKMEWTGWMGPVKGTFLFQHDNFDLLCLNTPVSSTVEQQLVKTLSFCKKAIMAGNPTL